MKEHHPDHAAERSVGEEFWEIVEGKKFKIFEEACEFFFSDKGIKVRFLPLESEALYPSIVRKNSESYSVGISQMGYCRLRCCAVALFVIGMELKTPGFVRKYIKKPEIVDKKPHSSEILHLQCVFEEMKVA